MASVNNPPNFKPLIDSQSTTQSTELTAAAQALNASIDGVKTELVGKSDSVKTAVNTAKTLIIDDAKVKTDALLVVVEAAKNAVLADISEKQAELQLAVDAPKSTIKSIQRGVVDISGTVNISAIDVEKSMLNISCKLGRVDDSAGLYVVSGAGFISTSTTIEMDVSYGSPNKRPKIYWEVIEYV